MESHAPLDTFGAAAVRRLIRFPLFVLFLLVCPLVTFSQSVVSRTDETSRIKKLYDEGRWGEILIEVPGRDNANSDLQMYRGLALARLERWEEARQAFEAGAARYSHDARFPIELGGVAYHRSNFALAKRELRRALRLEPRDEYANSFIGSIYFLQGNLEAALKYWNRANQPRLADLTFEPKPTINPVVLDRTVQFSPGDIWLRGRYLSSRARLEALGIYSRVFFDLETTPAGDYDLTIRAPDRVGLGAAKLGSAVSLLRGLPYLTIFPELYDVRQSGLNWRSLIRWDDQKRRFFSEASAPIEARPDVRYRIYFDGRNENWNLTNTLSPRTPVLSGLNLETAEAGAEMKFIPSGRWNWHTGVAYSYRRFRNLVAIPAPVASFFTNGSSLALRAGADHSLVRYPDSRFTLDASALGEVGTFFENPLGRYGRVEGSLAGHWFPQARGNDYELQSSLRAGKTLGIVPFDEMVMLGFERDNDLWLRGHPDLIRGQKGNAPMGRDFVLGNSEIDKIVFRNGLFSVRVGPFLDTGRVYDASGYFGTRNWLWDTGVQTKIEFLGSVEFVLGYGKDLRTGNNSFFTTVSR